MPYSYVEWLEWFCIVHSGIRKPYTQGLWTVWSTVYAQPRQITGPNGIRAWYLQVTSPMLSIRMSHPGRCSRFSVPPFSIPGGTFKVVSAYRGYVETSFNVPPGKLKLEKVQFQVTPPPPSFRLPPGVRWNYSFSVPGRTLKLVSKYPLP